MTEHAYGHRASEMGPTPHEHTPVGDVKNLRSLDRCLHACLCECQQDTRHPGVEVRCSNASEELAIEDELEGACVVVDDVGVWEAVRHVGDDDEHAIGVGGDHRFEIATWVATRRR